MKYKNIVQGIFKERPNRFIAHVEINGNIEICHVKNTGRCKELLVKDAVVFLEQNNDPKRKTKYSLIAVIKNNMLINMDSQAPNKVVKEWLKKAELFSENAKVYSEKTYKNSRFDFYIEDGDRKIYMEVKGVTLEDEGVARFPDAPTKRGIKHMKELSLAIEDGFEAYIFFVIQMKGIEHFEANKRTHLEFARTLKKVKENGVRILAYDCIVESDGLEIDRPVKVVVE